MSHQKLTRDGAQDRCSFGSPSQDGTSMIIARKGLRHSVPLEILTKYLLAHGDTPPGGGRPPGHDNTTKRLVLSLLRYIPFRILSGRRSNRFSWYERKKAAAPPTVCAGIGTCYQIPCFAYASSYHGDPKGRVKPSTLKSRTPKKWLMITTFTAWYALREEVLTRQLR